MKILHGMTEVAGQSYYSVKGLKELGLNASSAVWRANVFGYPSEFCLNIGYNRLFYPWYFLKMFYFFLRAAFVYDCFHFHAARSLLPGNMDLWFLKKLKKKLFFEFHGSELRGMLYEYNYPYFKPDPTSNYKKYLLKKIARYADGFILHDAELIPHLPKCDVPIFIVPLRVDVSQFIPVYPRDNFSVPIIVHAPSKRSNKGTDTLLSALNKIEIPCELVLVENKTQTEAFNLYKRADIVFDQISVGTYGVFAIEAMALGKPVLTYISEEMKDKLPFSLPIVNVTPNNLKETIEKLLGDYDLRCEIGKNSRKYVEEYHEYKKNSVLLKAIYEGEVAND